MKLMMLRNRPRTDRKVLLMRTSVGLMRSAAEEYEIGFRVRQETGCDILAKKVYRMSLFFTTILAQSATFCTPSVFNIP